MTQDDIIEIAREAGFTQYLGVVAVPDMQSLNRFVAIVSGKEREACAKVCEEMPTYVSRYNALIQASAKDCAAAIRARGNT